MSRKLYSYIKALLPVVCWLSATFVFAHPVDTLSLLFVGDLMQHKGQINAARVSSGRYDYKDCFSYVSHEIKRADLAVGNLEVPLGGRPYTGYPAFSAPDEYLYAIRNAGFDVMLLSNNHCLDRGSRGLKRTVHMLDSLRMLHTGVFRDSLERVNRYPLLVEKKGFRIVFLNYTYGTNGVKANPPAKVNYIDKGQILKDVVKARLMRPDVIIACMHWGIEYQLLPRKQEKELARWMIDLGVDHVIGSHPHVVQPLEVVSDSITPERHLIAYSLGNFISNMSAPNTDGGMVVKVVLKKVAGLTRMISSNYAFVWTSRPSINGKGQYFVYPSNFERNLLNINEKTRFGRFLEQNRNVVEKHSKGINEYFFLKKSHKKFAVSKISHIFASLLKRKSTW